jgi:hypothetical protein
MLDQTGMQSDLRNVDHHGGRSIEVLNTTMRIRDLSIDRTGVVSYLRTIPPDKLEVALIHALEVGITEMIARRERFRH